MPSASPAGTGVASDGTLVDGDGAVSSVSQLPSRLGKGSIDPYGTKGKAAAYEYSTGYRIGSGDRVFVRVAGETDLSNEHLVDGSGNISLPYVQNIAVAGLTTAQVEALISRKLQGGFIRDPQVSVQITTTRPFYILGEVNSSGGFPYQPGMSVQNAVAIAGGYSPRADHELVLLTRKNANGTATYKVPVTTQLYPGDIVYVRERWF